MTTNYEFQFSEGDIASYADLTQDFNPIHSDKDFAAKTRIGQPIVFGTMTLALVLELLECHLGPKAVFGCTVDVRFVRPVFVGQSLRVELSDYNKDRIVRFSVFTNADILAMSGQIEGLR